MSAGEHDFFDHRPDYVLSGSVKAIERFDSGDLWAAHLVMTMELVRQSDGKVIWQDDFDEEKQVFSPAMIHTVAALSGILGQRMQKAIEEIDFKFSSKQRPASIASDEEIAPAARDTVLQTQADHYELIPRKAGSLGFGMDKLFCILIVLPLLAGPALGDSYTWIAPPGRGQLEQDPTLIPKGKGFIFVPTMTGSLNEPSFLVLQGNKPIREASPGTGVLLSPGNYELLVGSGTDLQMMSRTVPIREGMTTLIKPFWAGLVINVMSENRTSINESYELYRGVLTGKLRPWFRCRGGARRSGQNLAPASRRLLDSATRR